MGSRRRKRRRFNWLRLFITLLVIIVLMLGIAYAAVTVYLGMFHKGSNAITQKTHTTYKLNNQEVFLIIGSDGGWPGKTTSSTSGTRSDTLILAIVNNKSGTINLLSIPRDCYVYIPGHGYDKITNGHSDGGTDMTINLVENLLDIDINHYIELNFDGFKKLVNAIGGVDFNVEKRMYYADPTQNLVINLYPGMQHLDGEKAMEYIRFRHDALGDISRIQRQDKFIKAMYAQMSKPETLTKIPELAAIFPECVYTDMTSNEIMAYSVHFGDYMKGGIHSTYLHGKPLMVHGVDYWVPDKALISATMKEMINGNIDKQLTTAQSIGNPGDWQN